MSLSILLMPVQMAPLQAGEEDQLDPLGQGSSLCLFTRSTAFGPVCPCGGCLGGRCDLSCPAGHVGLRSEQPRQQATGQLESTARMRAVRKDVARVLTVMNQKAADAAASN